MFYRAHPSPESTYTGGGESHDGGLRVSDLLRNQNLEAGGLAALSICESLLITLTEKGLLSDDDAAFVLEDALGSHLAAVNDGRAAELHRAAAQLIELIMFHSNSVRGASKLGNRDR